MAKALRPIADMWARSQAAATTRLRAFGAAFSNTLVGTWTTRRIAFDMVPRNIRTADPTRASEWIEGYIALADDAVDLKGRKLFEIRPPSDAFAEALHSFDWLRHLRAYRLASLSSEEAQKVAAGQARDHVLNWIANRSTHPQLAMTPMMCARRCLAMTNQAAFLLDDAEPRDYRAIMVMIIDDMRRAFIRRALATDPSDHCFLLIACASVAFSLPDHVSLKQKTREALAIALKQTFHNDGGPITRRPGDLPKLLSALLSLEALMETREVALPRGMRDVIAKGMRMLRFMRHPDGSLARFQGTDAIASVETDLISTILSYDTDRDPLPIMAPDTGYARLEAPGSVVLVDCGRPPPPEASTQAHASALAFEWSVDACKIITSAPEIGYSVDADIFGQRQTTAHSTVIVGQQSSAVFAGALPDSQMGARKLTIALEKEDFAPTRAMRGRHTGYRQKFGIDHARSLALSENGRVLEGRDQLFLPSGQPAANNRSPFVLAFQLQPGVRVRQETDRRLRITIRHLTIFFEADAGRVEISDPTERPTYRGPSRARRILVHGPAAGAADVQWRFLVQASGAEIPAPFEPVTIEVPSPD